MPYLNIICLPFGKDPQDLFVIRLRDTELGFNLKTPILEHLAKTGVYEYISNIMLYKLSIPIDDNLTENINNPELCKPLPLHLALSKVFPQPFEKGHLHVLVRLRTTSGGDAGGAALPSSSAAPQVPESPSASPGPDRPVGPLRAKFLRTYPHAYILPLSERQADSQRAIYCNRPQDMSAPIPLPLLHPVFGKFTDECETYAPTPKDHALVHEMARAMADFYPDNTSRRTRVIELFANHGTHLDTPTNWGKVVYNTAGGAHPAVRPAILVVENEVGSARIDPYAQGALEYIEEMRLHAAATPASVIPSFIITVSGPYLSIAGAAWGTRPIVQVLSPAIPFHFHPTDLKMQTMAARCLGAFVSAFSALALYYLHDGYSPGRNIGPPQCQVFPYLTYFKSLSGTQEVQEFVYTSQPSEEKLIFLGDLLDMTPICIEFVQHYSPATHLSFAGHGNPPQLLGHEQLGGGWHMIVMDWVRTEHHQEVDYSQPVTLRVGSDGCIQLPLLREQYVNSTE